MTLGKTRRGFITMFLAVVLTAGALVVPLATGQAGEPPLEGRFGERFTVKDDPQPAPDTAFQTRDGEAVSLADFKGRVVLLNFWATWCAPCVEEMPTLDALQAEMGSEAFTVLAVSQDMGGRDVVEPFLRDKLDLQTLDIYLDRKGKLGRAFELRGMPTTFLIDARGRVVGGLEGPADWNSRAVQRLVQYYIDRGRNAGVIDTAASPM